MRNLLGLSEAASLALHAVAYLARRPGVRVPSAQLAADLCVSHAHLTKVIQRLARGGVVRTARGPGGGVALAGGGEAMSLLEVLEAVEGPLSDGDCLLGRPRCLREKCLLGAIMQDLNRSIWERLTTATVADLAAPDATRRKE